MPRRRTLPLALLPVVALVFGCIEYGPARGPESGSVPLVFHAILSVALVFAWFWIDARHRGYRPSIFLHAAMLCFTVLALPYYLFRSRGFAGGLKGLALALLVFAVTMTAYRIGSFFG